MPRRILQGTVVSHKADKTITVRVEQRMADKRMGKIIRRSKKFHAHDATNQHKTGDVVRIRECRPISKHKHWVVLASGETSASQPSTPAAPAAPTEEAKPS